MLTLKPGLFTASGRDHTGVVWLDPLGTQSATDAPQAWLSGESAVQARRHAQHKGSFGDVAVVGGGPGMSGAALLAARAAHAAGAGRVFVEMLDGGAATLDILRPELMFRSAWTHSAPAVLGASTVVCGCGGGDAVRTPLPRLLSLAKRLVLDADALNALANDAALVPLLRARAGRGLASVMTPHPLEAARLLGTTTAEVQGDRLHAAHELSARPMRRRAEGLRQRDRCARPDPAHQQHGKRCAGERRHRRCARRLDRWALGAKRLR
jgi:NAD(P)H-hydrate repair Nnr-like enzyme with NAD(P)H-hydrate dehydratase domain